MASVWCAVLLSAATAAINETPHTTSPKDTTTSVTINPKLRKALLEALSNFEGNESSDSSGETTTITSDEIEEVTNNPSIIKVHSFSIDGDKSDENEIIKTIIISRPKTTLTPPIPTSEDNHISIKFGSTPDPINAFSEKTVTFVSQRSIDSRIDIERKEEKHKKKASEKSFTKPISTHTTTTLPPPVTNADGENIEKVEKDGVKIFQAPLLAAFTVQQDINGQPNKVISLFKNPQHETTTNENKRIINMEFRASQALPNNEVTTQSPQAPLTTLKLPNVSQIPQEQQKLISIYEQKQRQLEEQIKLLQARQREQEEFIRRHQILEQRLKYEEQQRRQHEQQQFAFRQQSQIQSVPQPQAAALIAPPSPLSNVQFIQSIPVGHTVGISVEQQLPFKGPIEFNPDKPDAQKPISQRQQQFQLKQFQKQQQVLQNNQGFIQTIPSVQKHEVKELGSSQLPTNLELPVKAARDFNTFSQVTSHELELPTKSAANFNPFVQLTNLEFPLRPLKEFNIFTPLPTSLEVPQKPFQTFNSAPLSVLPSLIDVVPQSEARNRVFRNDALQTGNFGGFHPSIQIQQQQILPIDGTFDIQLQNLLSQSGITSRTAEDFGLISKVLSLNHGVPNNLLFNNGGSFK